MVFKIQISINYMNSSKFEIQISNSNMHALCQLPIFIFTKAAFGLCKSISGKYSIFRKGKCFHVFSCLSKNVSKNIF